jgi:hypothetical protein
MHEERSLFDTPRLSVSLPLTAREPWQIAYGLFDPRIGFLRIGFLRNGILARCVLVGLFLLPGCRSVTMVAIPKDPANDTPPTITLTTTAIPPTGSGATGQIEGGKAVVRATSDGPASDVSVKVTRNREYFLIADASNVAGGIATFSLQISADNLSLAAYHAAVRVGGTAVERVTFTAPSDGRSDTLRFTVGNNTVIVAALATNWSGQITKLNLTYVPVD